MRRPSSLRLFIVVAFFLALSSRFASAQEEVDEGLWGVAKQAVEPLKESYSNLPPKGKLATGAVVGFTTSKFTVKTTVGALKVAGAAYVASEVLDYAGVLKVPEFVSDENQAILQKAKKSVTGTVAGWRKSVRNQLNPEKIQSGIDYAMKNEKMATVGFAAGAFLGFTL